MAHIGVIDSASTGQVYPRMLLEAGATVTEFVTHRNPFRAALEAPWPGVEQIVLEPDEDFDLLVKRCQDLGIDSVIAVLEAGVPLALRLSDALNGIDRDRSPLYDKAAMMRALDAAGVPNLAFCAIRSLPEGEKFFSDFDFSTGNLVLKPTVSSASIDVVRVRSAEHATTVLRDVFGRPNMFGERIDCVLAQEYCPGAEYVVDTFSYGGTHSVANVCVYSKVLSREGLFLYRGIRWLAPDDPGVDALSDYARSVLDAIGREDGSTHLEISLHHDGAPRLIEVGARAHGAGHPAKTHVLTGDSQVHREVAYLAGGTPAPNGYDLERRGRIVFFYREVRSRVVAEDPEALFADIPAIESLSLKIRTGDVVEPTRSLLDGVHLGMCFLVGDSEEQLDSAEEQVRDAFERLFVPVA